MIGQLMRSAGVLPQMTTQSRSCVFPAEETAALQLGHHEVDEVVEGAREIGRLYHEAVGQSGFEPLLQYIGNACRRAPDHPVSAGRERVPANRTID